MKLTSNFEKENGKKWKMRPPGFEPGSQGWEPCMLPVYLLRISQIIYTTSAFHPNFNYYYVNYMNRSIIILCSTHDFVLKRIDYFRENTFKI